MTLEFSQRRDAVVMAYVTAGPGAKRRLRRDRHALGASVSSAALLAAVAPSDRVRPEFPILELLEQHSHSKERQQTQCDQNGKMMASSLSAPILSPIRTAAEGLEENRNRTDVRVTSSVSPEQKSSSKFVNNLHPPENVELFAYSSALCHRLTGRYLPTKLLQQDPNAQQQEITRIQRHPKLLKAIDAVRTLSAQFKEVARDTMGHRKELGHTLFRIEESYLKLFESLLEISLGMYWSYEQATNAERAADKSTIVHWQEMLGWKTAESNKLSQRLAAKDVLCRALQIELDDMKRQVADLEERVVDHRELEDRVHNLMEVESQLRGKERDLQAQLEQLQQTHMEMSDYNRRQLEETRAQQKRIVDELKKSLREKDKVISKQDTAIRELSVQPAPIVYETSSSQTEVDDDGLWDVQDGIPRFVSKTVMCRMMWRRFNAFVTCKNCGGRPIPRVGRSGVATGQLGAPGQDASEFSDVWSLARTDKLSRKLARRFERSEQQWELPAPVLLFLSNLPKSVLAFPFYSLEQVVTQIEHIYDDKFASDKVDESDGVVQEELPKFICEYFLKSHELRQNAEIGLYRFLVSVKNEYLHHSHVHLFARFANLLRHDTDQLEAPPTPVPASDGRKPSINSPESGANDPKLTTSDANGSKSTHYLDRSFLRVFLLARSYLLQKPKQPPLKRGRNVKPEPHTVKKPAEREVPHVIQLDGVKKWVPLDHAITIMKWYLSYLPDEAVVAYCREVEHSTAIYMGGVITEVSGNRLAVRAEMRRAMLGHSVSSTSNSENVNEKDRPRVKPLIVADVHKVLLLVITALEERKAVMAKDLIALFDTGDLNHDRVLSLTEFTTIIRNRVPHFSDRRVVRMFREALMGGADQSFALSMEAFVQVCSDHGLVSLLPDDRMRDPFQPPTQPQAASAASGKTLASALDALTDPKRQRLASVNSLQMKHSHSVESLPTANENGDIPEELSAAVDEDGVGEKAVLSARAEEVSDDEDIDWEW